MVSLGLNVDLNSDKIFVKLVLMGRLDPDRVDDDVWSGQGRLLT